MIDFSELKTQVSIEQVLQLLGITLKRHNLQLRGSCLSMAETNCAKWRRESVPAGLREKGCEAPAFIFMLWY